MKNTFSVKVKPTSTKHKRLDCGGRRQYQGIDSQMKVIYIESTLKIQA